MTDTTTFTWDPGLLEYATAHTWGVLATGRRDGSPQQSMVGYFVDDEGRIVVSVKSYTAKWHNASRQPRVCITVPDGRQHLVVYGTAEGIADDPRRAELTASVFARMTGTEPSEPDSLVPVLDEQRRTVLRITPTRATYVP